MSRMVKVVAQGASSASSKLSAFAEFDFDDRLLKAIAEMGWEQPTPVQAAMIPLALDEKNILARARTGSGKTAAFLLPLIQKMLQLSSNSQKSTNRGPLALIIAPTKELASQIFTQLEQLATSFPFIQSLNLAHFADTHDQTLGQEMIDILVGTPGRVLAATSKTPQLLERVQCVVLDEADLLFSYGYQQEMQKLKALLPTRFQTIMTSATLNEDLSELKKNFIVGKVHSLKLKEGDLPGMDQLEQFHISCQNEEERFTILLALIKLKLLAGKSVVFVSTVDRCYKLHLFLQAFKVPSCVLNAEMPANSRCRIIHEFNQGRWPFLIASECNDIFDESNEKDDANQNDDNKDGKKTKKEKRKRLKEKNKKRELDKESGIGRGIDFHSVPNVINFDFPLSADMYVHRVGRTARGFNKGTAISFASQDERPLFEQIQAEINERMGQPVLRPYEVRMKDFEGFLLRARDVLAACTRTVIRETRMAEIREELLHSRRLDAYFAKNPRERMALEQDRKQFKLNVHSAGIADVPDYMVPKALRGQNFSNEQNWASSSGGNSTNQGGKKRKRMEPRENDDGEEPEEGLGKHGSHKRKFQKGSAKRKFQKRMADPLQSFKF